MFWLRFWFVDGRTGQECNHYFYCQGPYHLKEILDRYAIQFDDIDHIGIGSRGRTVSRNMLRELFKKGERIE